MKDGGPRVSVQYHQATAVMPLLSGTGHERMGCIVDGDLTCLQQYRHSAVLTS